MKRLFIFSTVLVLLLSAQVFTSSELQLLQIEEPGKAPGEKNRLEFNMTHVQEMVANFDSGDVLVNIEFADIKDRVLARLGTLKKGKIKWAHKVVDKDSMLVKFSEADFAEVVGKIKEHPEKPGLQIVLSDAKTNVVLKSYGIYTSPFPDLTVSFKGPVKASPGDELQGDISLSIKNSGTASSGNFSVDIILFREDQAPVKLASYLKNFAEEIVIKNGKETLRRFEPGESFVLEWKDSLTIPENTPPGKYYLGAQLDSGDQVKESDEENNVEKTFILISIAEPTRLLLPLPETRLVYNPATFGLTIMYNDMVLSDGKDWRKCQIRPYIFQIKHAAWQDFHWEIDTFDRSVWRIIGAKFCQKGGSAKEIKMKVLVRGGSKTVPPSEVTLRLEDTQLEYEPGTRKFNILSFGDAIVYTPFWQTCKLETHLYQFKHVNWNDFFWEVNTFKKEVKRISTGGKFCRTGGVATPLQINLSVDRE